MQPYGMLPPPPPPPPPAPAFSPSFGCSSGMLFRVNDAPSRVGHMVSCCFTVSTFNSTRPLAGWSVAGQARMLASPPLRLAYLVFVLFGRWFRWCSV